MAVPNANNPRVAFRGVRPMQDGKNATAAPRPAKVEPVGVDRLAKRVGATLRQASSAADEPVISALAALDQPMVTGASLRAQQVYPGDLFAALPGAKAHGADFVDQALRAGAAAVLTDSVGANRPALRDVPVPLLVHDEPKAVLGELAAMIYGDPSRHLAVLGITGTSGKTTTSYLVQAGLEAAGRTTGLIGTVETRVAGNRLASAFTTPEAPDLQALFGYMREEGVTEVAMEVSSHALALGRVAGTSFAVGAFTNLSRDHLDFHADMADYFAAKAKLFDGRSAIEVVCVDGDWGRRLVTPNTITVSVAGSAGDGGSSSAGGSASWTADELTVDADGGQSFVARGPEGQRIDIALKLPGAFNVANALVAVAILRARDVPPDAIATGLADVDVPGRMERLALGQDYTAIVDYSHKPEAVAKALDAVRAQQRRAGNDDGRVIVVLGCGGDRDAAKRPMMGDAAARRADLLIVTDDNPRSEDPGEIRAAMLAGALAVPAVQRGKVIDIGDRRAAIEQAVHAARSGDVIVVAGKGHETGQEIDGVVHPFSDRDELEAAIRAELNETTGQLPSFSEPRSVRQGR
ncbi:MAG: UDP-N-acetylmuramoyl-L-alanyl-D-glutamate--2,6-diaminopimelate ligase [Sciscionella sp.]|nr:UDP-N-acetylmuramoyl-L-alanyl-D-glutamate--2,6-diaminopimelate ligase [Sciscionella sp.]